MKDKRQIRPEWIPNAYNTDSSNEVNEGSKAADVTQTSLLLYSGKSTLLKRRHSKIYKKR